MSEENVLSTYELVIRFDQHEGNRVTWYIEPDEEVWKTRSLGLIDLAECGAPLAALGIRALWKLCADGLVFNALEQANGIQEAVSQRLVRGPAAALMDLVPEEATIN